MKVTYIRLENVAGIAVGSDKDVLEISFENSRNNIVSIVGANGVGKTVLLSSISPFSGVTSLDERSTLPYITPKKNGYKEIHYQDGADEYIIKHYYKATKDSHSVKSYFQRNGEELNENGNVTSFLALVEDYFGLTQEMMRLIRLGSNVNSFISLAPAKRKEYIGKLIEEIDLYMKIHKKISEDMRVVKAMMASNNTNLYNCHISDPIVEQDKLTKLSKAIAEHEKERDKLLGKIGKIKSLMAENDIDDLRRKYQDAEASLSEFSRIENSVKDLSLDGISVDKLITRRSNTTEKKIAIQSKINSYRISIDNTLKSIERLEVSVKKITSNNDMQSLVSAIESLRESIKGTSKIVIDFNPTGATSNDVYQLIAKLTSFNQISQMIHTFGSRPTDVYLKLKRSGKSVDRFLKDQKKNNMSRVTRTDLNALFDSVFKDDMIITPNCDTQYTDCPYYRMSEVINTVRDKLEEESYDDETLRYIQVISNNIDNILNELDLTMNIRIPDVFREEFMERRILDRLEQHLPFFDLSGLQEFLTILREYEIYKDNMAKLQEYEHQLSVYKNSGIDNHLAEIEQLRGSVVFYQKNIAILEQEIKAVTKELDEIDGQIALVTKYEDGKKYRKIFESTLVSTKKILEPLESASSERMELEFSLRQITNLINITREEHKALESKIAEYNRLTKESEELSEQLADLTALLDACSTKKGIPVVYMKKYLGKIQKLANDLLAVVYGSKLQLAKFKVTNEVFEVPYIKKGKKIGDIKYASQSEVPLATMALSFALADRAAGKYNILLLDEVDAGLDEETRPKVLKMLYTQMAKLKAEQLFIISHNMSQMINVPMDCIMLSDIGVKSKLQTIIYE